MSMAAATVLFAAAITPGPNNFVVMDVARRESPIAVAAPIAGIVAGTAALVVGIWFGLDALLGRWPMGEVTLRIAGFALLAYLAVRTVLAGWAESGGVRTSSRGSMHLFPAMLFLQVVNPKTWVLAVAVVAAHGTAPLPTLLVLVAVVPSLCLLVWAAAGTALASALARPAFSRAFAFIMGAILIAFAFVVLVGEV